MGFALATERSFFPRLTIRENLEFFAALENVRRREVAEWVETALSCVSLNHAAGKQAMKLSSGMYQKLGIARALVKTAVGVVARRTDAEPRRCGYGRAVEFDQEFVRDRHYGSAGYA